MPLNDQGQRVAWSDGLPNSRQLPFSHVEIMDEPLTRHSRPSRHDDDDQSVYRQTNPFSRAGAAQAMIDAYQETLAMTQGHHRTDSRARRSRKQDEWTESDHRSSYRTYRESSQRGMMGGKAEAPEAEETEAVVKKSRMGSATDRKSLRFAMIMFALTMSFFLTALDLSIIPTALPTIAAALHSTEFAWIGSAYSLTSTAFLPWTGGLANIFGRKVVLIVALGIMAGGSVLCALSNDMTLMIAGRAIQGIGGGAITTMTGVIVSDLVPLAQRGLYMSIFGGVWAVASAIGGPIGGALAELDWRWIFWLNLPICGFAAFLCLTFLNLKRPQGTWAEKWAQMDILGNAICIAATTSLIVALTWAGGAYAWTDLPVLAPLLFGAVGLVAFVVVELYVIKIPTVPVEIVNNRTALSGYSTTFLQGLLINLASYYYPVYFQAVKGHTPIQSSIDLFSVTFTMAPTGIVVGALITITQDYWWFNQGAWVAVTVGLGLMNLLEIDTPKGVWTTAPLLFSLGAAALYPATVYPVLAPCPIHRTAQALAFHAFMRSFGGVWGITLGGTILTSELKKTLPAEFQEGLGGGHDVAFASIGVINQLPEPLRRGVQFGFAKALVHMWRYLIPIAAMGMFCALWMKKLPLAKRVDADWGVDEAAAAKKGDKASDDEHSDQKRGSAAHGMMMG